jgi:hypothetical protein
MDANFQKSSTQVSRENPDRATPHRPFISLSLFRCQDSNAPQIIGHSKHSFSELCPADSLESRPPKSPYDLDLTANRLYPLADHIVDPIYIPGYPPIDGCLPFRPVFWKPWGVIFQINCVATKPRFRDPLFSQYALGRIRLRGCRLSVEPG